MKRTIRLVGWLLSFMILLTACEPSGESIEPLPIPQEVTVTPLQEPTVTLTPTVAPTLAVTATPTIPATPTQPECEDCFLSLPIAYVDYSEDPTEVVMLDPFTADELHRISAVALDAGMISAITNNGFFFIDEDFVHVHHLGFDGHIEVLDFLNPNDDPFPGVVLPSPDGERIAHTYVSFDDADGGTVKLVVYNIDGSDKLIVLEEYVTSRPVRPTPIKWSRDGEHLYIMNVIEGVGAYGGLDLYRIEIQTGVSEKIFPDVNTMTTTSISPDEQFAARVLSNETLRLVIRSLPTGDEVIINLPPEYFQSGEMVWAPDSSAVLISVWGYEWEVEAFSILYIDISEQTVEVLLPDEGRFLRPVAWQVMDVIWLNDSEGNLWRVEAGSLTMTLVAQEAWLLPRSQ